MTPLARSNMMRHFDEYLKPTFCPPDPMDEDEEEEVDSYHSPVSDIQDSIRNGTCRGHLVLSAEDMKWVFHPTFSKITRLVQDQVTDAERTARKAVTVWPTNGNTTPS